MHVRNARKAGLKDAALRRILGLNLVRRSNKSNDTRRKRALVAGVLQDQLEICWERACDSSSNSSHLRPGCTQSIAGSEQSTAGPIPLADIAQG